MVQTDRRQVRDGLREGPGWIAFARENGTVYHTYTVMAPDPFVTPYSLIPARADAERRPQPGPHLAKGRIPRLSRSDPPGCQSEIENGAVLPCPARCPARQLKDHRSAIPRQRRSPITARDTADGGCAQSPSIGRIGHPPRGPSGGGGGGPGGLLAAQPARAVRRQVNTALGECVRRCEDS